MAILHYGKQTLKGIEMPLDGIKPFYLSSKKINFTLSSKSSEYVDNSQKEFELLIPQNTGVMRWRRNLDYDFTAQVKSIRSLSGLPVRRSFVGSFEESLLSSRLLSNKFSQVGLCTFYLMIYMVSYFYIQNYSLLGFKIMHYLFLIWSLFSNFDFHRIDGFLTVMNITRGKFSPKSQKLPFAVTSADGDNCLLYYSTIHLPKNIAANKSKGVQMNRNICNDESQADINSLLHIPMIGRIQLTFLRQRITLSPSTQFSVGRNEGPRVPSLKTGAEPSLIPKTRHAMQLRNGDANSNGFDDFHTLRSMTQRMKIMETGVSSYCEDIAFKMESDIEESRVTLHCSGFESHPYEKTDREEDYFSSNKNHVTKNESAHSPPKINDQNASAVLRYALHLRFLCFLPKKRSRSIQKCKSSNSLPKQAINTNMDVKGEWRFYLYNDIRVGLSTEPYRC